MSLAHWTVKVIGIGVEAPNFSGGEVAAFSESSNVVKDRAQ